MNKITHEGNEYEVLTLDRISEITHAKLAGGKVVDVELRNYDAIKDLLWLRNGGAQYGIFVTQLEDLGIQPLKLLERKPVEFVAEFYQPKGSDDWCILRPDDKAMRDCLALYSIETKTLRCVEVTK